MTDVAKLVRSTSSQMAHSGITLPAPVIAGVTAFNKIHRIWRWFRLGNIYSNPDNFLKLAGGHGLNFAFGNSLMLRISATCVLVATRILECVEQYVRLQEAWQRLTDAVQGHYPAPLSIRWEVQAKGSFLSASTVAWWKTFAHTVQDKVRRVAMGFFHLCKEAFLLSMRITDAVESFSLSPATQNEGVNLFFVNGTKWIDRLVENKQMLIEGLTSNKKVIEKLLQGLHSPLTAHQLIGSVAAAMDKTEKVYAAAGKINSDFGMFVTQCAKKWGYEFLYGLGLHSVVPPDLVPPAEPIWHTPKHEKITERFIPDQLVTMPSRLPKKEPDYLELLDAQIQTNPGSSSFSLIERSPKAAKKKKKGGKKQGWSLLSGT